jgi:hypothetical protein
MFDKQFLQILAIRLSGGMSLDWNESKVRDQPVREPETVRCGASEAEKLKKFGDTMPI